MGILLIKLLDFLLCGSFTIHIGLTEITSGEKRNTQSGEVIRSDVVLLHQHLPVSRIGITVDFDVTICTTLQRDLTGNGRRINSRYAMNSVKEAIEKSRARSQAIVLALRQQCGKCDNMAAVKASRRVSQVVETAQQQSRGCQQRKRYRDLAHHKAVAEPAIPAGW